MVRGVLSWSAAAALVLTVNGCGAGGGHRRTASSTSRPSTAVVPSTTVAAVSPLTGLPQADASKLKRPALVVKIDNEPGAQPQAGLNQADVVFEEQVEGELMRFDYRLREGLVQSSNALRLMRIVGLDVV